MGALRRRWIGGCLPTRLGRRWFSGGLVLVCVVMMMDDSDDGVGGFRGSLGVFGCFFARFGGLGTVFTDLR